LNDSHDAAKPDRRIHVWLIEDNEPYRRTLSRIVSLIRGCRCDYLFGTAEAALEKVRETEPPDVVMLDIGLPGMDGITAIAKLRERAPQIKIIILTVFDDHDRIFAAICGGADGYLLKTSSSEDIGRAVREVVDGLTKQEISAELDISRHTVDTHVRKIYQKLHVSNRAGAVAAAIRQGLV